MRACDERSCSIFENPRLDNPGLPPRRSHLLFHHRGVQVLSEVTIEVHQYRPMLSRVLLSPTLRSEGDIVCSSASQTCLFPSSRTFLSALGSIPDASLRIIKAWASSIGPSGIPYSDASVSITSCASEVLTFRSLLTKAPTQPLIRSSHIYLNNRQSSNNRSQATKIHIQFWIGGF